MCRAAVYIKSTADSTASVSVTTRRRVPRLLSRSESLEVDGPLLDERVATFHRLLGPVVERERRVRELRHAGSRLGIDVERLLGQRQRGRALVEELGTPLLHFGAEVLQRHDLVDEAHRERVLSRVLPAEIPDLARLLLADDASEEAGAVPGIDAADAWPRLAEDRGVGGDREIAEHVQHVAAADRESVDHRDHGLGNVADRAVQGLDVHPATEGSARGSGAFGA